MGIVRGHLVCRLISQTGVSDDITGGEPGHQPRRQADAAAHHHQRAAKVRAISLLLVVEKIQDGIVVGDISTVFRWIGREGVAIMFPQVQLKLLHHLKWIALGGQFVLREESATF